MVVRGVVGVFRFLFGWLLVRQFKPGVYVRYSQRAGVFCVTTSHQHSPKGYVHIEPYRGTKGYFSGWVPFEELRIVPKNAIHYEPVRNKRGRVVRYKKVEEYML